MIETKTKFKKNISTFSLLMTGITTIIGSGWLLGTQKITEIAGPAGLISWVVGAGVAILVALFYLEIGTRYPSAGGIGFYSHMTHGRFCGFLTSWINWLSIVAVPPIEAQGIIQYMSNLPFLKFLYLPQSHSLTAFGLLAGVLMMILFMFINYWSVQFFIRFNNVFTVVKIIIPIITIICLSYHGLDFNNFSHQKGGFMPFGWSSVFVSVITCGVVMSFNGFQSPMTFSEEIASPKRMLPIAVLGSILIAFVIYFFLQAIFAASLTPAMLAQGWSGVNFRSPYVDLLLFANFHLAVLCVYIGSIISPTACGSGFMASSSRIMYSLAKQHHLPKYLSVLNEHFQNPRRSVVTCTIVGTAILLMFKGWYQLVAVISVLHIFSYIPAPIIALANRRHDKHIRKQQFTIPFASILSPILLFILSVLLFYAAWPLTIHMLILLIPGLCFYFYYEYKFFRGKHFMLNLLGASWLIFYLIGMATISYLGNDQGHVQNIISTHTSLILLMLLSLVIAWYGVYIASPEQLGKAHLREGAAVDESRVRHPDPLPGDVAT